MHRLRIALAQINVTVGDLDGNKRKILHYLNRAQALGVDLIAFPELVLTGYPPEDLLLKPAFIEANVKCLHEIVAETRGLAAIVGFVDARGVRITPRAFGKDRRLPITNKFRSF